MLRLCLGCEPDKRPAMKALVEQIRLTAAFRDASFWFPEPPEDAALPARHAARPTSPKAPAPWPAGSARPYAPSPPGPPAAGYPPDERTSPKAQAPRSAGVAQPSVRKEPTLSGVDNWNAAVRQRRIQPTSPRSLQSDPKRWLGEESCHALLSVAFELPVADLPPPRD